jgi:hypothetical protein
MNVERWSVTPVRTLAPLELSLRALPYRFDLLWRYVH